ncbi:MAG: hypothetical protein ACQEP7_03350 [bacterium]
MTDFNLSLHEYCAEDDTHTAQGKLEFEPDLNRLAEAGEKKHGKVIQMEDLETLVILAEGPTIHVHGNGKLVLNGVSSLEEAQKLIEELIENG